MELVNLSRTLNAYFIHNYPVLHKQFLDTEYHADVLILEYWHCWTQTGATPQCLPSTSVSQEVWRTHGTFSSCSFHPYILSTGWLPVKKRSACTPSSCNLVLLQRKTQACEQRRPWASAGLQEHHRAHLAQWITKQCLPVYTGTLSLGFTH